MAKEIGCAPNTVRNEIKRGKVLLYNGRHEGYRAVNGQDTYEANRENCGCTSLHRGRKAFLTYVVKMSGKRSGHWISASDVHCLPVHSAEMKSSAQKHCITMSRKIFSSPSKASICRSVPDGRKDITALRARHAPMGIVLMIVPPIL